MKKIRLLFSIAIVSLAVGACSSSPLGVECDPGDPTCSLHNPGTGSIIHNPGTGS